MRKSISALAAVAALLFASGGLASFDDLSGLPIVSAAQEAAFVVGVDDQTNTYLCCWVFIFGRWYCFPC